MATLGTMSKLIKQFVIISVVSFLVLFFLFKPGKITGPAMEPAYPNGSNFLSFKIAYLLVKPQRGDVVFYKFPGQPYLFIGRIVGLPGETVKIFTGKFYVNNKEINEPYLFPNTKTETQERRKIAEAGQEGEGKIEIVNGEKIIEENKALQIPSGNYFIMGDNRDQSIDSRSFGLVEASGITSKVLFRYSLPF